MSSSEVSSAPSVNKSERIATIPIRPRVFHIVSPLTGSKATIITTDTLSTPNQGPVLIQAAQRINRPSINQSSNTRKRIYPFTQESDTATYLSTIAAHRHRERLSKGLRYFSKKVCNKVQTKKITSYNEVATELVNEYTMQERRNSQLSEHELAYEQKNIRRRVYDAINVLLAMNIIVKDKKDIRWIGFPVNALFECELIDKKIISMKEAIQEKIRLVEEALIKQVSLQNLIRRNQQRIEAVPINSICFLPFFALTTLNGVNIRSAFSKDGRNTIITINQPTKITNETECLNRLGFSKELQGTASSAEEIERTCAFLPSTFRDLVSQMATNGSLKTLSETRNTDSLKISRRSTPSDTFVVPQLFKTNDETQQVDDEDEEADDDEEDVLSISSGDEDEESTSAPSARR